MWWISSTARASRLNTEEIDNLIESAVLEAETVADEVVKVVQNRFLRKLSLYTRVLCKSYTQNQRTTTSTTSKNKKNKFTRQEEVGQISLPPLYSTTNPKQCFL